MSVNWDGNPKLQFDKRRLERCYQLDYKDIEYKEECLTKVKEMKVTKKQTPYWNFWKVVFAGWLVRYPRQIFKFIGISVLFMAFMVMSITGGFEPVEGTEETGYNVEVIQ